MASKLSLLVLCVHFLVSSVPPVFSHFQYPHFEPNGLLVNKTDASPFGFLKNMQGCSKGNNVKGIRDLKHYLGHFGYLNYQNNPDVTNTEEDHFDDELEAGHKSYQVFYHLNATGKLDGPTMSKMFPDKAKMLMPRWAIGAVASRYSCPLLHVLLANALLLPDISHFQELELTMVLT